MKNEEKSQKFGRKEEPINQISKSLFSNFESLLPTLYNQKV
jgi:hypothetical protein